MMLNQKSIIKAKRGSEIQKMVNARRNDLKLRHNLDVMHIEKNICESLLGTFFALPGKSKDSINARLDFKDLGIRKDLHLKRDGDT
ncbi:hypothetical protein U9M48_028768 [Paspalum notatum var. saurae]|uniref:Uncharacterized protein n=1 Tax=Paspalum notatum var. saurae TaxID=547442 RepID=A0AAQ3X0W9_PASNO